MENKIITLENLQQYHENLVGKIDDDNTTLLETANEYTNQEVAKKSQVTFHIWEDND